ncbi:MAG: transposase [Burkholderiales bacterium]
MARYKDYSYDQARLIPISFQQQILPGTFESTLNYLIDQEFDLSLFEARYRNDETGAPAYDPAILLKIILYAYSRGIVSSREIARSIATTSSSSRSPQIAHHISRRLRISSPRLARRSACCCAMCCSPVMSWGSLGASSLP